GPRGRSARRHLVGGQRVGGVPGRRPAACRRRGRDRAVRYWRALSERRALAPRRRTNRARIEFMSVHVYIPTPFRRATNNQDRVNLDAADVQALLDELEDSYSGLRGLVRNEHGEVHDHVNIYVNSEGIEALQGLATPLKDGDEVSIIPALAGG